jgi:hypothetical protein
MEQEYLPLRDLIKMQGYEFCQEAGRGK